MTDSFLALALGIDPLEKDVMKRMPHRQRESFLSRRTAIDVILTALVMAIGTIYIFNLYKGSSPEFEHTAVLTALVFFQLFNVFNVRSDTKSVFVNIFTNKWLLIAVAGCIGLQYMVTIEPLSTVFKTTQLSLGHWLTIIAIASSIIVVMEIKKLLSWLLKGNHSHVPPFIISLIVVGGIIAGVYFYTEENIPSPEFIPENTETIQDYEIVKNTTLIDEIPEMISLDQYIVNSSQYHRQDVNIKGMLLKRSIAFQENLSQDWYYIVDDNDQEILLDIHKDQRHLFFYEKNNQTYNVTGELRDAYDGPEIKVTDILKTEREISIKETIVQERVIEQRKI